MADRSKGKRKREPFYPVPPMIPDVSENIARTAVARTRLPKGRVGV